MNDIPEDADNVYKLLGAKRDHGDSFLDAAIAYDSLWLVEYVIAGIDWRI